MRSLLIGVAAFLLLASGCSGSDDSSATSSDSDAEGPATDSDDVEGSDADSDSDDDAAGSGTDSDDVEGSDTGSDGDDAPAGAVAFLFTVEGVVGGQNVPTEFTCDGANAVPAVSIEGVPSTVEELVLIVDDPDAPTESPFVHWVVYGISPGTSTVTDGDAALTYGVNDAGAESWLGPCPPPGDGLHTYRWKLFGLSTALGLEPGLDGRAIEDAIADVLVTDALLISSYERAG